MTVTTPVTLALAALLMTAGTGHAQKSHPRATQAPVQAQNGSTSDPVDRLLSPTDAATTAVPAVNDGEAYHRADDAQQDPAELRTTRALNDEIASRNQLAENQERADREAYDLERARYQATVDQATRDRLAYEEAARQAEAARRQWEQDRDAAERARGQYAADLLACRAGDRSRCGSPK
ncbi:hypothetical protein MMB232_00063 [Brevundimonas subvibrioides]|uniref:hypothetical protein n=1 Tax=Brevundimonas subvibrioides TaxID=74313 RepID=UPI0032D56DB3